MKKNLCYLFFGGCLLWISACNSSSSEGVGVDQAGEQNEKMLENRGKDEKAGWFAAKATGTGLLEIELGRLASSKATLASLKDFGTTLQNHHVQVNAQLKQIADLKNLVIPTRLGDDDQEIYNRVMNQSGAAFDKAYLEAMVETHEQAVKDFEEMAQEGTDPELKAFAMKNLPMLQAHLSQAKQLEESVAQ